MLEERFCKMYDVKTILADQKWLMTILLIAGWKKREWYWKRGLASGSGRRAGWAAEMLRIAHSGKSLNILDNCLGENAI